VVLLAWAVLNPLDQPLVMAPWEQSTVWKLPGLGGLYERMATSPDALKAYMSPYTQNVTEIAKAQAIEDAKRAQLGANLGAVRQGTYGGARQALAQSQREAGLTKQLSDIQTRGLESAYDRAIQSQQFGVGTELQGLQAAMQGSQIGLQGVGAAQAGFGLAGQQGQGACQYWSRTTGI
jgi:hypothetical protein